MDIIFSKTATQNGFGSAMYKKVDGLTNEEKEHLFEGGEIVFRSRPSSLGVKGTTWRKVLAKKGNFYPRVPGESLLKEIEEMFGK